MPPLRRTTSCVWIGFLASTSWTYSGTSGTPASPSSASPSTPPSASSPRTASAASSPTTAGRPLRPDPSASPIRRHHPAARTSAARSAPAELRLEGVAPVVNMRRSDWSCWAFLDPPSQLLHSGGAGQPPPARQIPQRRPPTATTRQRPGATARWRPPTAGLAASRRGLPQRRPGVPARPPAAAAPRRPGAAASRRRGFRGDARGAPLAPSPRSLAVR